MGGNSAQKVGRAVNTTTQTGNQGEDRAAEWLREHGFELLHRNWRSGHVELDIVAMKDYEIHFVEVKTRRAGSLTAPEEAMTPAKIRSLFKAARAYLAVHAIDAEVWFDLIAIEGDELRYIPNAFAPGW